MDIYSFQNTCINNMRPRKSLGFYIYFYLRIDGTPYYVGKGNAGRAWDTHGHTVKPPKDKSLIIIAETNLTEIGAMALERRYIEWYGRKDNHTGILRNMTDGGEGTSGYKHTIEAKQAMSVAKKGKKQSLLHIENAARTRIGVKRSDETKQAISKAVSGYLHPMYGKTHTKESREKIAMSSSGRIRSKEASMKTSLALRKTYEFVSPDGVKFITDNMIEFCKQHTLSQKDMYKVASGTHRSKNGKYKGWMCTKLKS